MSGDSPVSPLGWDTSWDHSLDAAAGQPNTPAQGRASRGRWSRKVCPRETLSSGPRVAKQVLRAAGAGVQALEHLVPGCVVHARSELSVWVVHPLCVPKRDLERARGEGKSPSHQGQTGLRFQSRRSWESDQTHFLSFLHDPCKRAPSQVREKTTLPHSWLRCL